MTETRRSAPATRCQVIPPMPAKTDQLSGKSACSAALIAKYGAAMELFGAYSQISDQLARQLPLSGSQTKLVLFLTAGTAAPPRLEVTDIPENPETHDGGR